MNFRQQSFTLIELLVVISIIGVLGSIVLASLEGAKDRADIAKSQQFSHTIRTSLGDKLVGEWRFDDSTEDSSGSDNHGAMLGDPSYENGMFGQSLDFDGNDCINCGDDDNLDPGNKSFTVETWFKWDGTGGENIVYNKENLYEARVLNGYFHYAWRPHWSWDGGTHFPVTSGKWHHAVVTYDKSNQYLYKDGELAYSRDQIGNIGQNTSRFLIGARGNAAPYNYFYGIIDEVRIYNKALSSAEIQQLYAQGAASHETVLITN